MKFEQGQDTRGHGDPIWLRKGDVRPGEEGELDTLGHGYLPPNCHTKISASNYRCVAHVKG